MLHAIKPMIWQAMQTLKDPAEDSVKRSQLQVLSHNLSAEGVLAELLASFDATFPADTDKVECRRYLDTAIHDAVKTLKEAKSEKEQKICVERVHKVCWELCRVQLKGSFPSMLTQTSTMIWWKIFNTFAERDSENQRTLYPVTMDWEEVDYWANVVLKVMALPTNTQSRKERDVLGSVALNFQEALVRFNAKLNENNGMYVLDHAGKHDLAYIENAMQELNTRLFEGIHLSGSLLSVKKSHAHTKWCVLYQLGLAFADSPAEVDSSNPRAFIPISMKTEVTPIYDKSHRPVRFELKNSQDQAPLLFEANNISVRNKWVTAIICLKYGKLPDYEKDFINRRKTRTRNRELEAEARETMKQQKERTIKKVAAMEQAMEQEKQLHASEADQMRTATAEVLRAKISEHDERMAGLMLQMTELGHQYEQEKATMMEQNERQMQQLVRQHGDQMGSVQNEWEAEVARLREQLEREMKEHKDTVAQKDARIAELEAELAELKRLLADLEQEKEANTRLRDEAERLTNEVAEMSVRIGGFEEQRDRWQEDSASVERLAGENAELRAKAEQLEEAHRQQLIDTIARERAQRCDAPAITTKSHRGPGFDSSVQNRAKLDG